MTIAGTLPSAAVQEQLRQAAEKNADAMIDFARRLIQTPSLPGEEREIAELVAQEMRTLGYDDVWTDEAGNVIGVIRGTGNGPTVQFNSHIDHVATGDPSLWERPPYAAVIEDDVLYGRAASDVKGAMASQVYLAAVLRDAGVKPNGDVYVVGVVLEEVGGFGSRYLAVHMPTDFAVLSEATNNQIARGHRGRAFVRVSFTGLSTHASAPERGRNPHYAIARFLLRLEKLEMVKDETFGGSSVAPTLIETDQASGNVTPATVSIYLDWRNVPSETHQDILAKLEPILREVEAEVEGITGKAELVGRPVRTYTGLEDVMPTTLAYETPADHPLVTTAKQSLENAFGREVTVGTWTFATDGGHLHAHGIETIGFSAGEERYAHTIHDQIDLKKLRESLFGNAVLALDLTAIEQKAGA